MRWRGTSLTQIESKAVSHAGYKSLWDKKFWQGVIQDITKAVIIYTFNNFSSRINKPTQRAYLVIGHKERFSICTPSHIYSTEDGEVDYADAILQRRIVMISAFYPYKTLEEFWAYFSKHIYYNRYEQELNGTYDNLLSMVKGKNYFVITTNVDHIFQKSGFDKERLFYMQGDYGLFQCPVPCHTETYDNKDAIYEIVSQQRDCKIPSSLIPYCPKCGKPMTTNLRKDNTFVQDAGWYKAASKYNCFIQENSHKHGVFLELGVGYNTPSIIKFPFYTMTQQNAHAHYISINASMDDLHCPQEIKAKSILLHGDIAQVMEKLHS